MPDVLCPNLYNRLLQVFGSVEIASEGEPYQEVCLRSMGQLRKELVTAGEYYRVNCPVCSDNRHRLYINHRYAHKPGMAICFNETMCMTGPHHHANREKLKQVLLSYVNAKEYFAIKPSKMMEDDGPPKPVAYPGQGRLLSHVEPDHPACQYLRARRFDPTHLARQYGVGVVDWDKEAKLVGRILAPIHLNGQLVGWQGRHPADLDWKAAGVQKYWNLPGMKKGKMLYGYDQARAFPYCVVVEGVTDVWRVGPPAVCVLGSHLGYFQRRLICSTWRYVFVMLDPDAMDQSRMAVRELQDQLSTVGGKAVVVPLPDGKDPADLNTEYLAYLIGDAAESAGVLCV